MIKRLILKYLIKKDKPSYIVKPKKNDFVVSQMYMKAIEKSEVYCYGEPSKLKINRFFLFGKRLFNKCIKIKNQLFNLQYNDYIIENTISNIIENGKIKIIKPRVKKSKKPFFVGFVTLVFLGFCIITTIVTFYNIIPNTVYLKINQVLKYDLFLLHDVDANLKKQFESILPLFINIHIPIFVGFIGVYFTVLGIALNSKKNVSFKSYFKFTSTKGFYLNCIILLINFVCTLILTRSPLYSKLLFTSYIFNILHIVFCCYVAISKMACIQDYKKAAIILQNNCVKYIHDNKQSKENPILADYFNFLRKCFDSESYDLFLTSVFEKDCYTLKDTEQLKIYYDTMLAILFYKAEDISVEQIEATLRIITKQIIVLLGLNVINYSVINYLIDSFSQIYTRAIFDEDLQSSGKKIKSYLILFRDSLYVYLLKYKYNENLKKSFSLILKKSVQIITASIEKNNNNLTDNLLKDFRFMIQFFKTEQEAFKEILAVYQDCLVDIIVNLLYLIYRNGNLIDYSNKIQNLIDDIEEIRIYAVDTYFYEEKNPSPDMIEVKYERSYFIVLFLIFLKEIDRKNIVSSTTTTSDLFVKIFNKLCSGDKYPNDKFTESYIHYSILQRCTEKIKSEDNILKISNFEQYLQEVKDLLSEKIKEAKERQIDYLTNQITIQQLNERINQEILAFRKSFSKYSDGLKFLTPKKKFLKTNFSFSAKEILNMNNSYRTFGIPYENYYHRLLLNSYIATNNIQLIQIKSLSEIIDLKRNEENILYGPLNYRTYFRTHQMRVEYNENAVIVDDFVFSIENMPLAFPGFVLKADLEKLISLDTIISYLENCDKRKEDDSMDIFYDVPIEVTFNFEMGQRLKVYKLI